MSRKAEFLAVVKTIVDKDSNKKAKQSTIELAQELSDVLNAINVKPDTDDFKELKDVFNEQLAEMGKQPIVFSDNTLKGITAQFANAISEGIKAGMAEGSNEIKSLLKDGVAIKDAYENRNKLGRGSKTPIRQKFVRDVKEAFEYEPVDNARGAGRNLATIKGQYEQATNWEDQYIALLKYIKAYEALERTTKDPTVLERWKTIGDYTIEQLKESKAAIQSSLQNIINVAYDKPLIGLTQDGTIDVNVDLKPLKTLDAYDVTDGKGEIEVPVKPVIKMAKKNSSPNAFRGVHRPDNSEGKLYTREFLGGEFWADKSSKDFFMEGYGAGSGDDGAASLSAVIKPLNKLTADAFVDGAALPFYQIDKIKLLKYLFPGIEKFSNIASPDGKDNVQKFYNEMARQAGFDLLEVKTVDEGGDDPATTLVPLQERIIEYASKIPEYYDTTKFTSEIERIIISQQKGTSERWYDETINRLELELNQAIKDEDGNKIADLQKIIPELKSMRQSAMEAFDKAIVSYGGYIEEEVKRGLPQVIKSTDNGSLIGTISEDLLKKLLAEYDEINQKAANWDDNSGTDKEFQAINDRMKEIKEQLLFSLSDDLKEEADEILTDFEFGDKTLDETFQYFAPKLTYSDSLPEQSFNEIERKSTANEDAAESARKAADEAERERQANEESADAAERKAKAEREAADARRTELVKQLDEYGVDTRNADQAQLNLDQREQIHKALVDENLITDEIEEKYSTVNKRLEDRLALLKQVREHEHNINGISGSGLITNENDPQVYYEEWFKPFKSDVENIRKSGLFSAEEIEHYNIRLVEMQDYLQSIAKEALNNYLINPDEVNDAQKLNEILNQRQKILATVEQFDNPLDSPSSYEEAIKLNQAIKDRIDLLQKAEVKTPTTTGTGDASSEELKSLRDKNDQLRQEKENAEKDKKAANERANEAEAEAERLRNELANRDKADSEKPASGTASIDTSELESLLSRVTYKVKFEGESPLDNSASVLETVKSALSSIQVNASTDGSAPWARENTLSGVIKNLLENIKANTTGLSDALKNVSINSKNGTKDTVTKDYKKVTKDDYAGSTYFPEKLKTQVSKIEEYRAKLATSGRLTQEMDKQIDDLLDKLRFVKNGPEFSVWSEEFKKLRIDENTSKIFDDFIGKENKNLYQELIDLKKQEYEWEIKLLNAQQGSAEETNARQELEAIQEKIKNHSVVYEDYEQELKLQKMQEEQLRKINELSSKQVDSNNKQKLKEETEIVKELNELYQQLAQAKAMADAETDSILRKPFEDRANQIQSEIYAKEANIDRAKYSQQFDNTQKESYKKQIIEELLELYAKLGEAEAKEDRMSIGNATAQQNKSEMDALYKRIEATQKLIDVNEELQNQFDAAQKIASDKVVVKANKADAVSDDKSFEKLGKQYEKLGKLRAQAQSTGSAVTQEDARQLEEAIKKEQERVSLSKEQTEELKRRLEVARQNELLRQNSIKQQKGFEQQIKDSRSQARLNTVNSTIRSAEDINRNAMMIDGVSPESLSKMKELNQAIELLKQKYAEINAKGGVVSDEDQKDVVNQIANVKKLSSEVNDLVKEYNNMNDDNAKTIGKFNGSLNSSPIDEYKRQLKEAVMTATNGKASIKGFDAETKTLSYSLKNGSHEFTNYTAAVRGADGALVSIQKETKRTETFIESITRKTKEIGTYLISSLSLYDVINKFRQGIQYVREIDSALTELKKVTDETEETYDRFLDTASKTAGKVGSTIKEIVSSTADWARLGYSMEEAAQLAESTSVLLNVSEFSSIEDATSALTSTLQAFGYVAEDSMHVVDVLNEVGNNFAISSDGIATALQDSASALMAANNSYEEAVALIAAANRVNF